ncbi:MAG TPA: papain-like cysteine protease family protein [Acidimicrobiales bacterium]
MGLQAGSSIPLIAQPTDVTCWAASIAMLVGTTPEEVCEKAGMSVDQGYGWDDIRHAVSVYGLTEIGPACGGPDYFAPMLERSPLWIVEVGAPYHAVVLTGVYTDSDEWDWNTARVTVNNPWPPGSGNVEDKPFLEFANEYELGSGAMAQIVSR